VQSDNKDFICARKRKMRKKVNKEKKLLGSLASFEIS
jgi:hypothetical protein